MNIGEIDIVGSENEIWKTIPGHEKFQVSNLGRIKHGNKITLGSLNGGYRNKVLKINGHPRQFRVHRLVMLAFVGDSHLQVNHKNGLKYDNRLDNLEYVTPSENQKHAYKLGLQTPRIGVKNGRSKLKDIDVYAIRALLANDLELRYIANKFKISRALVDLIKKKTGWKHHFVAKPKYSDWQRFVEDNIGDNSNHK